MRGMPALDASGGAWAGRPFALLKWTRDTSQELDHGYHIQADKFTTTSPAIQYSIADETWTVESGWVVFMSSTDAVHSDLAGSVLINNGNIISGDLLMP